MDQKKVNLRSEIVDKRIKRPWAVKPRGSPWHLRRELEQQDKLIASSMSITVTGAKGIGAWSVA